MFLFENHTLPVAAHFAAKRSELEQLCIYIKPVAPVVYLVDIHATF